MHDGGSPDSCTWVCRWRGEGEARSLIRSAPWLPRAHRGAAVGALSMVAVASALRGRLAVMSLQDSRPWHLQLCRRGGGESEHLLGAALTPRVLAPLPVDSGPGLEVRAEPAGSTGSAWGRETHRGVGGGARGIDRTQPGGPNSLRLLAPLSQPLLPSWPRLQERPWPPRQRPLFCLSQNRLWFLRVTP